MEEQKKVNLAVIGCGLWGPNLIRNFSQIGKVSIVCDLDKNKLENIKKQYPDTKTTWNYGDLLKDNEIAAIIIATPVATHFQLAKQALESGKHVFIEKPLTASSKEAEELFKLAKTKNLVLMVDHTFQYSPAINKIKEIISSGELGKIHYLHADWLSLGRLQPEVNVIWDLAVHVFSTLNYILGKKPTSLNVKAQAYFREILEEVAFVSLNFPDTIKAFVKVSWTEPEKTRKIIIVGNKKMLVYNMLDKEQIKIYNKSVNINKDNITYLDEGYEPVAFDDIEPLKLSCSHFLDCIKNNKQPLTDGENGLEIVKILEATNESIKNNGSEVFL